MNDGLQSAANQLTALFPVIPVIYSYRNAICSLFPAVPSRLGAALQCGRIPPSGLDPSRIESREAT